LSLGSKVTVGNVIACKHVWGHNDASRCEVTVANVKITMIWDVSPYSLVEEPAASIFNVEVAGRMFIQNYDSWLQNYTAYYP
jgi:hypothetical protein